MVIVYERIYYIIMKNKINSNSDKRNFITKLEENEEIYNFKGIAPGGKEKILDIVAKSAYNNDRAYEGCTRSVLSALIEHLHLSSCEGVKKVIRTSIALAAVICRIGEVCGALTGEIEDSVQWYKDRGLDKCPMVCATAAKLTAEIILNLKAMEGK